MSRCQFSFALPRMDLTLHAALALTQEDGNCKGYQTRLNHMLPNMYSKRAYSPLQLHRRGGKKESKYSPSLSWTGVGLKPQRPKVGRVNDRPRSAEKLRNGHDSRLSSFSSPLMTQLAVARPTPRHPTVLDPSWGA